jgi:hypothetical protein
MLYLKTVSPLHSSNLTFAQNPVKSDTKVRKKNPNPNRPTKYAIKKIG